MAQFPDLRITRHARLRFGERIQSLSTTEVHWLIAHGRAHPWRYRPQRDYDAPVVYLDCLVRGLAFTLVLRPGRAPDPDTVVTVIETPVGERPQGEKRGVLHSVRQPGLCEVGDYGEGDLYAPRRLVLRRPGRTRRQLARLRGE